jgi:hypothetical protein
MVLSSLLRDDVFPASRLNRPVQRRHPQVRTSFQEALFTIDLNDVCVTHMSFQSVTICTGCLRRFSSRTTSSEIRPSSDMLRERVPQVRPMSHRGASIACWTS